MGSEKNPEIEYLRALAVVLLVMSHLPELLPFHKATFTYIHYTYVPWTGVDLFFCISGYVVSKSLVEFLDTHKAEGNFWLAAQCFWIRRMYRLIPSSWTWLFIGILCSVFFNQTGVFNSWWQNLRSASAILTFSGNLANQYNQLLAPNDVYWSLALAGTHCHPVLHQPEPLRHALLGHGLVFPGRPDHVGGVDLHIFKILTFLAV